MPDLSQIDWPAPCVSNMRFASTFPGTLKRARVKKLSGLALGPARFPDCYRVKWSHLKTPWVLHENFFKLVEPT